MKLEFAGQTARDQDNVQANPSRLVNCYREPTVPGGRTNYVIKSVLGTELTAQVSGVFVRAIERVNKKTYVIHAGSASEVDLTTGSVTLLDAVDDSVNASISGNNGDVVFASGGKYYRWDGAAMNEPTAGAFTAIGSVTFIANRTVLTELDGRRFEWSDVADANNLPGLNFSTADGRDDNIIRGVAINGMLYLFKEESIEVWFPTGQANAAAFERQAGGIIDVGLKAHDLLALFDGGAFMVGDDNRAYIVSNGLTPVSTPNIETMIEQNGPLHCTVYGDEGHTFLCIHFQDSPSACYDMATGEWHERAFDADLEPWAVVGSIRHEGKWYIARTGGNIEKMVRSNMDVSTPLVRELVSRTADNEGDWFPINQLEIMPRQGFTAGTIELSMSRDGGVTWGSPKPRSIGPVGAYGATVKWNALGSFKQATAKLRISDAVDVSIDATMRVK